MRGLFPVQVPTCVAFVVTVNDVTDKDTNGKPIVLPMLSVVEQFQEAGTGAFRASQEVGVVKPGQGFPDWVSVLDVFPEALVPPRRGQRRLRVAVQAAALRVPEGASFEQVQVIGRWNTEYRWFHDGPGWMDVRDNTLEADEITLRLAEAVGACGDESDVDVLVDQLKEVGDDEARMAALELCFDAIAAAGDAAGDFHALLGIDKTWNTDQVRAHLNRQCIRWNARAETLRDEQARAHAEKMLVIIASARRALIG